MDIHYLLEVLFPYLVILYAADCLSVVRRGHLLFTSGIAGGMALNRTGLALSGILPTSWAVMSHNIPVPVTELGIYLPRYDGSPHPRPWCEDDFIFLSYEDIESISVEGRKMRVNHRWPVSMPSAHAARMLSSVVEESKELSPGPREKRLRTMLSGTGDLDRAREELNGVRQALAPLEFWSTFFSLGFFFFLPLTLYVQPLFSATVPLTVMLLAAYILIVILFARTHLKFYPEGRGERFEAVAALILLPVGAAHAVSKMTRDVLSGFDHLTLAALLASDKFGVLFREEMQRTVHSARLGGPEDLMGYWERRESSMKNLADISGIEVSEDALVHGLLDDHAAGYCPLCGTQYREGQPMCADCRVSLKPI